MLTDPGGLRLADAVGSRTWSGGFTASRPGTCTSRGPPRSIAQNHLFLADLTDRIQVFDRDGKYLRGWRTPEFNVDGPAD